MTSEGWTFGTMLRRQAATCSGKTALSFRGRATTYRQLDSNANRVAHGLAQLGVRRAARVAILDFNSDRYFEAFFGTVKLGATLVGINARLAAPEVAYIVSDARAEVLFVGQEHYELVESLEAQLLTVRHIVALGDRHPRWLDYESWRDTQAAVDGAWPVEPTDDFIQLYTSGTTGHPKGVCHTHRNWRRAALACRAAGWGNFDANSVTLVSIPLFHVAGFTLSALTLLGGGQVVVTAKVDPAEMLEIVPRYRITDTLWVPAVILAVTSHPNARTTDFSSLRTISYGAAPMPEDLLRQAKQLFGCGFVHLYGLTEILGAATYLPAAMHAEELGKLRSCGRAYDGLELRIVDAQDRELKAGEVGEVLVRCPWTMREYWGKPQDTLEALRGGWLHTGDAGRIDGDGYLYIVDRVKDMIITGGENVYPAEVENALFGHPAVADVAAIGVPDMRWGEAVKALVVLKPGATLDVDDLSNFARARIAGYKAPKFIEAITELPRNASGKVLRRVLRDRYGQRVIPTESSLRGPAPR